jgi:hypothetical protein
MLILTTNPLQLTDINLAYRDDRAVRRSIKLRVEYPKQFPQAQD